nr:SUMF1/EgtB/PvdO family nonheme iron enzyme [Anaerolineaceae bacterium]
SKTPTRTPDLSFGIGSIMIREEDGMEMVFVPAGEFEMGSDDGDSDEYPVRQIYMDAYWIDKFEVSNAQYARCVAAGVCSEQLYPGSNSGRDYYGNPDYNNYPVINVTWEHAQTYCEWVGGNLPTEAQWEKASRGTDGRSYPWGEESPTCQLANFNVGNDNICVGDTNIVTAHESGASPYGALNLAGNVWEWVYDWYGPYKEGETRNPLELSTGFTKVFRGGSWEDNNGDIRSANRSDVSPSNVDGRIGFRCVVQHP